jgi:hypothetical protein
MALRPQNNELQLTNRPSTGCRACGAAARHHTPGLRGARLQLNSVLGRPTVEPPGGGRA